MSKSQSASLTAREALKRSNLHYVTDESPGFSRAKHGEKFAYKTSAGKTVRDADTLLRIRALAIPPAYHDVWISRDPRGHIQAVGYDDRGRKQYRYHADWRKARDTGKYKHVIAFAKALPEIRKTTAKHLKLKGLPRDKVLAAVVRVMEKTLIRVGNEEYAKSNHSYGLTTLQNKHVTVKRRKVKFHFRGKSGVEHEIDLDDPKLAKIVHACQELPHHDLFNYVDHDGAVHDITSGDVNEYLHRITGHDFTAKDFRTWAGTVLAATALQAMEEADNQRQIKRNLLAAIDKVAERLGNTRAVCRKAYIHPAVMNAYIDGELAKRLKGRVKAELKIAKAYALDDDESAVLRMLERKL